MTQNSINNSASIFNADDFLFDANTLSISATNTDLTLTPDGTGIIVVDGANFVSSTDRSNSLGSSSLAWDNVYVDGITFDDGTNNISSYISPTSWTPTLTFGGSSTGITYSTQTAYEGRVGPLVWINITLVLTSKGSASGNAAITGCSYTPGLKAFLPLTYSYISYNNSFVKCFVEDSTGFICQFWDGDTTTLLTDAEFNNDTEINITGLFTV